MFQHCLRQIRLTRGNHEKEEWAERWAIDLRNHDSKAIMLNKNRETCLKFLYTLHDRVPKDQIVNDFQGYRIGNILGLVLVMDRAQALFSLQVDGESRYGMHWFAQTHASRDDWKEILKGYPGVATIDKRLLWYVEDLDDDLKLNRGQLKAWLEPQQADSWRHS